MRIGVPRETQTSAVMGGANINRQGGGMRLERACGLKGGLILFSYFDQNYSGFPLVTELWSMILDHVQKNVYYPI